jgi:hypothetical protein
MDQVTELATTVPDWKIRRTGAVLSFHNLKLGFGRRRLYLQRRCDGMLVFFP